MMPITATRTRSSVRLKPRLSFHKRRDRQRNPGSLIDTIPSLVQARRVPACATFSTPRFFETLHERSRGLANYWTSVALRFDTSFATLRHSCLALPGSWHLRKPGAKGSDEERTRGLHHSARIVCMITC